jgi:hypothetical protein
MLNKGGNPGFCAIEKKKDLAIFPPFRLCGRLPKHPDVVRVYFLRAWLGPYFSSVARSFYAKKAQARLFP